MAQLCDPASSVPAKLTSLVLSKALPRAKTATLPRAAEGDKERRAVDRVCIALNRQSRVECRIGSTVEDLFAAFTLVYEQYRRTGMMKPNACRMRITPYHLLPTTEVLVTREQGTVTCTMSLVCDGLRGLPMESVYPDEIAKLRLLGLSPAEVSCLAERYDGTEKSQSAVFQLMPLMAQLAYRRGADRLLISVRPRHARFYQRFLGFDMIGDERSYGQVCGTRGVALSADLSALAVNHPRVHQWMFGVPFAHSVLEYKPLPDELFAQMRHVVDSCSEGISAHDQARELALQSLSGTPD